jgi:cytochrome c551/c552
VTRRPLALLAAGALAGGLGLLTLERGSAAAPVSAPDGADVFHAKGCATCHTGPDSAAPVEVGPPLDDVAAFAGTRIAGTSAADYVRLSVLAPQSFTSPVVPNPGVLMPTLPVAPEELDALVAYLLTPADG